MKIKHIILFIMTGALLYSCEPQIDDYNYTSGNADFSTYVAIGNSLTAGYADGALYKEAQETSFPAIMAKELKKVGGGEFTQPLMPSDRGVGLTVTPEGLFFRTKLVVGYSTDCLGTTSLGPVLADPNPNQSELGTELLTPVPGPFNNMGVPGAKSFHLFAPSYGTLNPYFGRFASSMDATVLGDVMAQQPTFFSLWIGANDALGYAMGGGVGDTLTSPPWFGFFMSNIVSTLTSGSAKGALGNVPNLLNSPYFTTIPPNGYVLSQGQADTLNMFLGPLGFQYQEGPNYFIIEDTSTQLGFRQMTDGEFLTLALPQDSLNCAFWGGFNPFLQTPVPIPGHYVVDATEAAAINAAINGYNETIAQLAGQYDLALVDINTFLASASNGMAFDGETLSNGFITGNAFSLDGLHLTPKGNAMVANLFIEAINKKYGSTIPMVSTTNYRANLIP
jgi:lysophospholipase L1-like esterase